MKKILKNYILLLFTITIIAVYLNVNTAYAQTVSTPKTATVSTPKAATIIRPYISIGFATNPFHTPFEFENKAITPEKYGMSVPISIGMQRVNPTNKLLIRVELEVAPATYSRMSVHTPDKIYEQAGTTFFANIHVGKQWKYGSFYGILGAGAAFHEKNLEGFAVYPLTNSFALNLGVGAGVNISKHFGIDLTVAYQYLGKEISSYANTIELPGWTFHTVRPTVVVRYIF